MRNCAKGILTLAILVAWGTPARPADKEVPLMVPEGGAIQVMLLRQKSVRDDLHLTADEAAKIQEFTSQQWKKAQKIHELKDEAERHAKFEELTKENEKFIDEVLEPSEHKRLNEITLQNAGLAWVTRPEIASALGLTDEQKEKAVHLQKEAHKELHDLIHSGGEVEARHVKLREHHIIVNKRLMELFTDKQEVKWKELCGVPFTGHLRFEHRD